MKQVYAAGEAVFGNYQTLSWSWDGENSKVPPQKVLDVTSATFSYFPSGCGTVGRADLAGREAGGAVQWRLQAVYAEPKKTVHLTFPDSLSLDEGGYVEIGFTVDGPGTMFVELHGKLRP
jgi:hypothetical protein